MAERFGGRYSPSGQIATGHDQSPPPRPTRGRGPFRLYPLTPVPFLIRAFSGGTGALLPGLAGAACLALACWLTLEGQKAEAAYTARKVARRPAFPRKIAGAVLTAAGLYLGAQMAAIGGLQAMGLAVAGLVLHLLTFGPDPLRDKGMAGVDTFQTDRVARAVDEAEDYLAQMKDAILRANDRALETRVERFATAARGLFRGVEADPHGCPRRDGEIRRSLCGQSRSRRADRL
jgi:hypothetical protein